MKELSQKLFSFPRLCNSNCQGVHVPVLRRPIQTGECVPAQGGRFRNGAQGPSNSYCRGFFVPYNPATPKPALLSESSLTQEKILLLH